MQTTYNNRTYTLTEKTPSQAVQDHMMARGWDGKQYIGESQPVGRQRKVMHGLFYRAAATGEFEFVVKF